MRYNAEMIANLNPHVPLVADMDTGFGGPIMVDRAVTEYARAGVAAFHIEVSFAPFRFCCTKLTGLSGPVVPETLRPSRWEGCC